MKSNMHKYLTFIKYVFSAGISFTIDIGLFYLMSKLLVKIIGDYSIIVATIIARLISSFINYLFNKNYVFKYNESGAVDLKTLLKYYGLVGIQMLVSALSVFLIHRYIKFEATIIKIFVDIVIFVSNYIIQKNYIYKN